MVDPSVPMLWLDVPVRRGVRDRTAQGPCPSELGLMGPQDRALLARWVRDDALRRGREALMKLAHGDGIERAEALCDQLLKAGWLTRREQLVGGTWQWQAITWRDLGTLKTLLGVGSAAQRQAARHSALESAAAWLSHRTAEPAATVALDPELQDELEQALAGLAADSALPLEALTTRLGLARALAEWHDAGREGSRRDFALQAQGGTKAIGGADWRWLAEQFDLERLRITGFAPVLWLAGALRLAWQGLALDLSPLQGLGVLQGDVLRADAFVAVGGVHLKRFWLIENRASFERQARSCPSGTALLWMPGRPTSGWMNAVAHLLRLAPVPAWISADADPSGVDIALGVGALWSDSGLSWTPHRMGVEELEQSGQCWPLNDHDRAMLLGLLQRLDLPAELRALCMAMQTQGLKAEQEGWL